MQSEKMYKDITLIATCVSIAFTVIVMVITRDVYKAGSVLYAGALNVISFQWLVYSSRSLLESSKAKRAGFVQYALRYAFYGMFMYVGATIGLHIVYMLFGLMSINLAIKIHAIKTRKEG